MTATTALAIRRPLEGPPPTGPLRASGRLTVAAGGAARGRRASGVRSEALGYASVWAFVPGTDLPWLAPLYLDEAGAVPAAFPVATDADGVLLLWSPTEAHLEVVVAAPGYAPRRLPLDLEDAPVPRRAPPPPPPGFAPHGEAPVPLAADYTRSHAQTTVLGAPYGPGKGTVPLAGALVWAYTPGTDAPWLLPLYGDAASTEPLVFPVPTDESGQLALWADAPARVELRYQVPGYVPERVLLDLEPPPATVEGPPGARGSLWFSGSGGPSGAFAAADQDQYLDLVTGDVWAFEVVPGTAGSYGSGPYGSGPYGGDALQVTP